MFDYFICCTFKKNENNVILKNVITLKKERRFLA